MFKTLMIQQTEMNRNCQPCLRYAPRSKVSRQAGNLPGLLVTVGVCLALTMVSLATVQAADPRDIQLRDELFTKFISVLTRDGTDPAGVKFFGRLRIGMPLSELKASFPSLKPFQGTKYGRDGLYQANNLAFQFGIVNGALSVVTVLLAPFDKKPDQDRFRDYQQRLTKVFGVNSDHLENNFLIWNYHLANGRMQKDPTHGSLNVTITLATANVNSGTGVTFWVKEWP